jgi:uncharacterized protein YneF (UPF0154 family)
VNKLPIALRLMLLYLALFLLAQVVIGEGMWLILRQNLFTIADAALEAQAADLQRLLEPPKDPSMAQLQAEVAAHFSIERSRDYLQIADAAGNIIYRSRYLEEHALPPITLDDVDRPIYENRKLGQQRFRFLSKQLEANGRTYIVRIGHPMREESATLDALRGFLLWATPVALLAASAAGYWLSRRALPKPQNKPAWQVRETDSHDKI